MYYYRIHSTKLEILVVAWVDFEWDGINESHLIDDHGVDPYEAEEVVRDDPNVITFAAQSGRIGYIGRTDGRPVISGYLRTDGSTLRANNNSIRRGS